MSTVKVAGVKRQGKGIPASADASASDHRRQRMQGAQFCIAYFVLRSPPSETVRLNIALETFSSFFSEAIIFLIG